jgi:uncharacterized repeat protein (TIGR03803 family)
MFRNRSWSALLIAAFLVFPAATVAQSHFKVLHSFEGKGEGAKFPSNIVMDASGNLYGVATQGGYSGCSNGCGAVYELSPTNRTTAASQMVWPSTRPEIYMAPRRMEEGHTMLARFSS